MRSLTEEETKTLFTKIANYTGSSLSQLVAPTSGDGPNGEGERMVFRIQKDRVFYMPLKLANLAVSIPRASLLSVGTMIGKCLFIPHSFASHTAPRTFVSDFLHFSSHQDWQVPPCPDQSRCHRPPRQIPSLD